MKWPKFVWFMKRAVQIIRKSIYWNWTPLNGYFWLIILANIYAWLLPIWVYPIGNYVLPPVVYHPGQRYIIFTYIFVKHVRFKNFFLCFNFLQQLFLLLAPHLLEENEPRRSRVINPAPENPYNIVDPNIFRIKIKSTTSKVNLNSKHK